MYMFCPNDDYPQFWEWELTELQLMVFRTDDGRNYQVMALNRNVTEKSWQLSYPTNEWAIGTHYISAYVGRVEYTMQELESVLLPVLADPNFEALENAMYFVDEWLRSARELHKASGLFDEFSAYLDTLLDILIHAEGGES